MDTKIFYKLAKSCIDEKPHFIFSELFATELLINNINMFNVSKVSVKSKSNVKFNQHFSDIEQTSVF